MLIRPATETAVFTASAGIFSDATLDALELCYRENGFVILRDVYRPELLERMQAECATAQRQVVAGDLPQRYGSTVFLDEGFRRERFRREGFLPAALRKDAYLEDPAKAEPFANYVEFINELSPAVRAAITSPSLVAALHRVLGVSAWLRDDQQFGVVYQDARPGRESGYSRIGWHSDWQAGPSQTLWPSTAFTIHLDATSPANGFLRVVPGSHNWATPAPYRNINNVAVPPTAQPAGGYTATPPPFEMPLAFEAIPGEVPVIAEVGDVILHDCYLWHSAARATDDDTTRRHVRGAYYAGDRQSPLPDEFIKNAAR
ncbi:phytanoyl-CoA dioxygenase PhyH [Jatrophihabitans sp. GAS493]|uniref:phytanoyl-CoA dioxygenase family protein n=1 Tax=Jatrophihabitans sp. GAS493 TaxID=1907575 RepID=UPI000BB9010C|nr:phytanoyl-CoA dioxygenase family protein [Jatrophihabitans sp. GAS493]SOD71974.1 phytanoyl-CoA dioxygenase PhyH [Jatrophihabitans sp. GAS493]